MTRRIKIRTVGFEVRETQTPYGRSVDGPATAAAAARAAIAARGLPDRENFVTLYLSTRGRVVGCELTGIGTLNSCLVHPREVFRGAIAEGAASIVVVHNHPSGDVTPSEDDLDLARRLHAAGEILGIPLADFLVVSLADFFSATERGLLTRF